MRRLSYHLFFCLLLAWAVSACNTPETTMTTHNPSSSGADADTSTLASRYKQNSHPKQRYDITMTIADAPGPFASIKGFMQFDVVNSECLPPPDSNPNGYNSPTPTIQIPTEFTRISDTEYVGTFYTDMMVDEDYYGRGICHWQPIGASVRLKATGAEGETKFLPSLSAEDLLAEQTKTIYFLKKSYPRHPESTLETPLAFGAVDRSKMPSNISEDDLFTITLAAKRMTP